MIDFFYTDTFLQFWDNFGRPLCRIILGMMVGIFVANVLESLRWTRHLAKIASPLARVAHLGHVTAAAFSTAFFSAVTANGLLAEHYEKGELDKRELVLSNLFNSLPAYLAHTPSIFFLIFPVLGFPAVIYVALTLLAACMRTLGTVIVARCLLARPAEGCVTCLLEEKVLVWSQVLEKAWKRFKRRVPKMVYFTVPVYIVIYFLQTNGLFLRMEEWLAENAITFLPPEAMGIIALHLAAELGAALSAAGAAFHMGALTDKEVVLALLIGNILSTPMRALRHQLPSYAGFFRPATALHLVLTNQGSRALSMICVTVVYYAW